MINQNDYLLKWEVNRGKANLSYYKFTSLQTIKKIIKKILFFLIILFTLVGFTGYGTPWGWYFQSFQEGGLIENFKYLLFYVYLPLFFIFIFFVSIQWIMSKINIYPLRKYILTKNEIEIYKNNMCKKYNLDENSLLKCNFVK